LDFTDAAMKYKFEPFWWSLFGGGGVISSMLLPILLIVICIVIPLGLTDIISYELILSLLSHWITKVILFVTISLSLFHWAHRFRFTLYEGLQLHHYDFPIALACYGFAVAVTIYSAYFFWNF